MCIFSVHSYDPAKTWSDQLTSHHITDCVIAAGFTRDDDIEITVDVALNAEGEGSKESVYRLTGEDLDDYDVWSGEIKLPSKLFPIQQSHIALYGGGIAFPQFYRDEEGEEEPWIGVKRSIQQTELMIKSFLAARSTHHHEYIEII